MVKYAYDSDVHLDIEGFGIILMEKQILKLGILNDYNLSLQTQGQGNYKSKTISAYGNFFCDLRN